MERTRAINNMDFLFKYNHILVAFSSLLSNHSIGLLNSPLYVCTQTITLWFQLE
jgi:hypothetical protein